MGGLVRTALRLCAVKALSGRTFAKDRVQDSSIAPMAEAITESPLPVIVVYTDEEDMPIAGLDLLVPTAGTCAVVFLVAVAGATRLDNGTYQVAFPETDAASELTLDLIERDIKLALLNPRDKWAELWRAFAMHASRWLRQLILDVDPLADPVPGAAPSGLWAELIAAIAADADADFAGLAPVLERAILGPSALSERELAQVELGLTKAGAQATGLEPGVRDYTQAPGEELAPLVEVEVDAEMAIDERVSR